jgi:hypothetical protein
MIMMALARRKWLGLGTLAFLVIALVVAWRVIRVPLLLDIGTGYAAQQTCACLYISHRALDSCLGDLEPLARKLISVRPAADEVTASGFAVVSATAHYEPGFGCALRD